MPVQLLYESYVCDARPYYPLLITAKRYWDSENVQGASTSAQAHGRAQDEALTLVCTHGVGFHKEHWEPTIQHLLELDAGSASSAQRRKVREVWSIDAPNHGDAAVLNEETLKWGYTSGCT